jgi:hypothetical protein
MLPVYPSYALCVTGFGSISNELQFVNIFSTKKVATLCSVGMLCLLICINEIIQVTKGQKYFPERLYFDQGGFGSQAGISLKTMCML